MSTRRLGRGHTGLAQAFAFLLAVVGVAAALFGPRPALAEDPVDSALRSDPASLRFGPRSTEGRVRIHNDGDHPVALDAIRIEGADWGSFRITDESNPDSVPSHGWVELHLRADARSFAHRSAQGALEDYGRGRAFLVARSGATSMLRVALDFGPPSEGFAAAFARLVALMALGVGLGVAWTRRGTEAAGGRSPLATALAAMLGLGALPWSHPLCAEAFTRVVGPLELAQCRELGGSSALLPLPSSALLLLLAWTALRGPRVFAGHRGAGRWLSELALICALTMTAGLSAGSLDLESLVSRQALSPTGWREIFGGWYLFENPFAAAAWFGLLRQLADEDPLSTWVLAAWTAALVLGGPDLGGAIAWAPHALTWVIGLAAFAAKTALLRRLAGPARGGTGEARHRPHPAPPLPGWVWLCAGAGLLLALLA